MGMEELGRSMRDVFRGLLNEPSQLVSIIIRTLFRGLITMVLVAGGMIAPWRNAAISGLRHLGMAGLVKVFRLG